MKFIAPALVALVAPAASAYSIGVLPNGLFTVTRGTACRPGECGPTGASSMMPDDMRMMRRRRNQMFKQSFQPNAPNYQVVDDEELFSVQIDVPGVKADDLNINLEEDGKMLTLSGSREKTKNGYSYTSEFSQSFYVDPTIINTEKFSANLQNGVLIVSAPKDLKKLEETIKSIPITELPVETIQGRSNAVAAKTDASTTLAKNIQSSNSVEEDVHTPPAAEEAIDLDAPTESDEKA